MLKQSLYITCKENIQYLTGFTGSSGSILLTPKVLYFFTDSRYFEETKKTVRLFGAFTKNSHEESYKDAWSRLVKIGYEPTLKLIEFKKGNKHHPLTGLIKKHNIQTLLFEENHVSFARYRYLKGVKSKTVDGKNTNTKLKTNSTSSGSKIKPSMKLKPSSGIIETLRTIKTPQEIKYVKKAQGITEKIYETLKKTIKISQTELEIDRKIRILAEDFGADGQAFDPIVAFGPESAIPHHKNSQKKLKKGDLILIDMGAKYHGYHADMTRVLFTTPPTSEQKNIYSLVLDAHELAVSKIQKGVKSGFLEKTVRDFFKTYEPYFTHALGHGVGLEIHESPSLSEKLGSKSNPQILEENMLITIEPGIYLPGKFGIRLENIYQVTKIASQSLNTLSFDIKSNILS